MDGFTLSQIFINLLVATKWTLILSLIAFVGGGLIGALIALMRIAREVADRIIFLAEGQLIADTTPDQFFNNPKEERLKTFLSQILH